VTLREIRAAYPDLFYKQEWFEGEAFMDFDAADYVPLPVSTITPEQQQVETGRVEYPYAAALLSAYVKEPDAKIWDGWKFWCADMDSEGHRVYVFKRNGLMEIHRHIHLTTRFVVPVFA
jgi:hypothetical protein